MFSGYVINVSLYGVVIVFCALFVLVSQRVHVLMVLLGLELVVLGIILVVRCVLERRVSDFYFFLVVVRLAACEAAVGLGLLVSLIHSHGSDFVSFLSVYEC